MKVLFAASEVYPLIKTGGLADVAYGLPQALHKLSQDVRIVLPAYSSVVNAVTDIVASETLEIQGAGRYHAVRLLQAQHPAIDCPVWLVQCDALFARDGNPYLQDNGVDWSDNAERFCVFSRAVAVLADDGWGLDWRPDIVHANDWQTGLVPALLQSLPQRPRSVFTIHNLAYGGHFSKHSFDQLGLPWSWWTGEGVEFYGGYSMLKAGIAFADTVSTVSPTYAQEICRPELGYGLDGLLRANSAKLHGILNGVDDDAWNPQTDPHLPHHYGLADIQPAKKRNKRALLKAFGFSRAKVHVDAPLIGFVGRLVEQKGIDMVLAAIPKLVEYSDARFVLLGSGDWDYEQALNQLMQRFPGRVSVYIGYNETRAHLLEAGCDLFLMPSRFEPCGLNQMYSLKYGTLPVVYATGGLADTVVNASDAHIKAQTANGFVFYDPTAEALTETLFWALGHFRNPSHWRALQRNAMRGDYGWDRSAKRYLELYR